MRRTHQWRWPKSDRKELKNAESYDQLQKFSGFCGFFIGILIATSQMVANLLGISSMLERILLYSALVAIGYVASRFELVPLLTWLKKRRLERSECGACIFSLAGLSPESDGCTVCPECGAAWRRENDT